MKKFMVLSAIRQSVGRKLSFRAILAGAMVLGGISPALASIYVWTNINLITSPTSHSSSTANSSVAATSTGGGGNATSDADTDVNLSATVSSTHSGLTYHAGATSQYSSAFSAYNSSLGTSLPPGTSMVLSGTMSVSTDCSDSLSIASSKCNYRMYTLDQDHPGSITLRAQAGIPTITVTGTPLAGTVSASVSPTIKYGGDLYHLNEYDLDELGITYDLFHTSLADFQDANFSALGAQIATAIFNYGLSSLEILPGVDVDTGFDVDLDLTNAVEYEINLRSGNDSFFSNIILDAQTSTDAEAAGSFTFTAQ